MTLLIFKTATWRLPPQDNGLKCVIGVSLKSRLLESNHARRKPPFRHVKCVSACHVTTGIIQVLLSGASENCPLPLCTNSLFRKWEEEKITDQRRTNSLTSSSCLSTFRTSCVFSSEREKNSNILISRQRNSASWQQPNSPATGEVRGREKERDWEKTTHEDTFEDIFTHSLYMTSQHLMSLSYWRLWGLCWFLLRSSETPRANSKGREVSALLTCQKYESHSEWLTRRSAPHPVAALPHLPIETYYDLRALQRSA